MSRLKELLFRSVRKVIRIAAKHFPALLKLLPKRFINRFTDNGPEHCIKKIPYEQGRYQEGINLFGYLKAQMGLGQGARLYASAIIKSGIPFRLLNFSAGNPSKQSDKSFQGTFSSKPLFNTNIFHVNPEQLPLLRLMYSQKVWDKRYNIHVWLWELEEFPEDWQGAFEYTDEIWTPSSFTSRSIENVSPVPVFTIPYGIRAEASDRFGREYFRLPDNRFLFLCMYDVNSMMARKNPFGAIDAYFAAFGANNPDTGLVIKINNSNKDELAKLKQYIKNSENVFFIEDILSRVEVHSLIKDCDAFISLHRSEGFGLVMAEAMYLGIPAIATNWSANTDFMNSGNSCPVDFKFIDVGYDYYKSKPGQRWADPSIEHTAYYMQKLFSDKTYYSDIANAGQAYITSEYSEANCARKIVARLTETGKLSKY